MDRPGLPPRRQPPRPQQEDVPRGEAPPASPPAAETEAPPPQDVLAPPSCEEMERLVHENAGLQDELRHARAQLEKAYAQRMMDAMHPKGQASITEEDAAALILSKCQPDAVERFGIARETAPPGMSDANIIAALLTMLCNQGEQHTGDYEAINQTRVVLPAGRGGVQSPTPAPPVVFGREPRACGTCQATFTPTKQGQRYGCNLCGEYQNYLARVQKDRETYDPQRVSLPFPTWALQHASQCTCPGQLSPVVTPPILQSPLGDVPLTRPKVVVDPQGREMIIDEPLDAAPVSG